MNTIAATDIRPRIRTANYFNVPADGAGPGNRKICNLEFVMVVQGRILYTVGGETTPIESNQILLIEPRVEHCILRDTGSGFVTIGYIHHELLPAGKYNEDYVLDFDPPRVTDVKGFPIFQDLFRKAADSFRSYDPFREELLECIVREIWLRLVQLWRDPSTRPSPRVQDMQEYLKKNLLTATGRQDLAKAFFLTPEHVTHLFKKELGITPTAYLMRERVMQGHRLIQEQGLSIKEAAAQCGFCDQYYFSKVFKRTFGFPPSQVR